MNTSYDASRGSVVQQPHLEPLYSVINITPGYSEPPKLPPSRVPYYQEIESDGITAGNKVVVAEYEQPVVKLKNDKNDFNRHTNGEDYQPKILPKRHATSLFPWKWPIVPWKWLTVPMEMVDCSHGNSHCSHGNKPVAYLWGVWHTAHWM